MSLFSEILARPIFSRSESTPEPEPEPQSEVEVKTCPETHLKYVEIEGEKYILKGDLQDTFYVSGPSDLVSRVGGHETAPRVLREREAAHQRVLREREVVRQKQAAAQQRVDRIAAIEEGEEISPEEVQRLAGGICLDSISPTDLCN